VKIRNVKNARTTQYIQIEKVCLTLSSNQDSVSRVFLFLPTHYAAGLSWCIQVACEENPSRLEKLTARREGSK